MKEKLIIAHRGDTSSAAGNTVESFQDAVRKGADMIECDVRRTKDGVLILCHDDTVQNIPVKDLTWDDISKINKKNGFAVPKLEDAIKSVPKKIKLDIELKEGGYEEKVVQIVKRYFSCEEFVISSFDITSVKAVKKNHPEIKVGLILGVDSSKGVSPVKLAKSLSLRNVETGIADFFVAHWSLMKLGFLRRIKKCNKPLLVWTVNNKKMMRRLFQDDTFCGIITDKVESAIALRNSLRK